MPITRITRVVPLILLVLLSVPALSFAEDFREGALALCMESDQPEEVCHCWVDQVEQTVPASELDIWVQALEAFKAGDQKTADELGEQLQPETMEAFDKAQRQCEQEAGQGKQ